jgi:ABC-type lipoprotein release transport system permease subunit
MSHLLEISRTGLAAVLLHPLRSVVCIVSLVAVLLPWLVGEGLAKGVIDEAERSARFGADLYVAGRQFGRPAPLPLEAVEQVRRIDGVTRVEPRIVGEVILGIDRIPTVVVGVPPELFDEWSGAVEGRLPTAAAGANQLVVGASLARRLHLDLNEHRYILPFYQNENGVHTSIVVGIFKPDAPLWQSNLVLTTFATAAEIFDQPGLATDLLVWCRPNYQDGVSRAIERRLSFPTAKGGVVRARVTAREDLLALLPRGPLHLEGLFNLHFLLAFVVAILVLLVTSGLGLAERRREIGILKATGWQTDEILLRGLVESLCLVVAGACLAVVLAWVWLRLFNGYGVAGLFLDGVETAPGFRVPFRLTPAPVLIAFVLAFVIVLSGTMYSAWRSATAPPREAMR